MGDQYPSRRTRVISQLSKLYLGIAFLNPRSMLIIFWRFRCICLPEIYRCLSWIECDELFLVLGGEERGRSESPHLYSVDRECTTIDRNLLFFYLLPLHASEIDAISLVQAFFRTKDGFVVLRLQNVRESNIIATMSNRNVLVAQLFEQYNVNRGIRGKTRS